MLRVTPIPTVPEPPLPDIVKQPSPFVEQAIEEDISLESVPCIPSTHLQELLAVDRLLINKRLMMKNMFFLKGKRNQFYIRTPDQNLVYLVEEENKCFTGYLCYGLRPLRLHVFNAAGQEVITIGRPLACTSRILPCHLQHLDVWSPPDFRIGVIDQQWSAIRPLYVIKDAEDRLLFWVRGPKVTMSFFRDVQFEITRPNGDPVGATCKRWQGLTHALFYAPVTDRFGIAFEMNLPVKEKALLLAAALLLEYMYYDV